MKLLLFISAVLACACQPFGTGNQDSKKKFRSWEIAGGGLGESIRYSSLKEINRENVGRLEVAWTYHTGDADTGNNSQIQCNPIIVDGTLYGTSPALKLIALDAATGKERWIFDPVTDPNHAITNNRGVTWWENGKDKRILYAAGSMLYAVNARTGKLVESFGSNGKLDLHTGLDERSGQLFVSATSPGIIYRDLFIIGTRVSEGSDAASGDIRAFNAETGELAWIFHTIPRPGETGYETWEDKDAWKKTGGANSWAGMSIDMERGIVFVPTGSAGPDFYGGNRKGANLFANCVLALDAATGKRLWHFQTIHHDLWDRDVPSAPGLVRVQYNGSQRDAVAQATKTGFIFLLDRETGRPLFPVEEKQVPVQPALPGEKPWPTQPVPLKPAPFLRQEFKPEAINRYASLSDKEKIKRQLEQLNYSHMFSPPSLSGIVMFPGFDGGAEWGGTAFDPATGLFYVNSNEVPWAMTMVGSALTGGVSAGRRAYLANCVTCHGPDQKGSGDFPSLESIDTAYSRGELLTLLNQGRRRMPGFSHLSAAEKTGLINYLLEEQQAETSGATEVDRYVMTGYKKMQTTDGYPAIDPPWGTLNAINLNTGEYAWRIPLGEYPELKARGIPPTGTENYGGPVVTAGGLLFIAATPDTRFRAFDKKTGELLWEKILPAPGFATPAVYEVEGRQYVVIACGGGKLGSPSGDAYVAFALPEM
ncbi:quinoprotein glucose dehydrogenase [Anseongella ginsenosidimutans]|uniref:Quinoprotein glucose dehydrogenase n=1 Tax=Anseongella ginsenosidimutans TaxID=496056 RepID=A0A4R3KRD5_9SPHI|nr:PQQ-binding-like beta-propeller repeat protein [Anseongella ginsenosidimutans]QEC52849.1 PQQ-binding-like beta-propeller repeat protein [Anseongella ginsenosidimutans]TCS87234.1 quinoprotein glucose dehydrogenase [Anseongella ginsenosidimutans]